MSFPIQNLAVTSLHYITCTLFAVILNFFVTDSSPHYPVGPFLYANNIAALSILSLRMASWKLGFVPYTFRKEYAFPAQWQEKPPFLMHSLFLIPQNCLAFNGLALHHALRTFQPVTYYFALKWNQIFSSFLQSSIWALYKAKISAESSLSRIREGSKDWWYWLWEYVFWHCTIALLDVLVFSLRLN